MLKDFFSDLHFTGLKLYETLWNHQPLKVQMSNIVIKLLDLKPENLLRLIIL